MCTAVELLAGVLQSLPVPLPLSAGLGRGTDGDGGGGSPQGRTEVRLRSHRKVSLKPQQTHCPKQPYSRNYLPSFTYGWLLQTAQYKNLLMS